MVALVVFAWIVSFFRDYESGKWYWKAKHIGWGWDHPSVYVKPAFGSKAEAVNNFKAWIESQPDRQWREK